FLALVLVGSLLLHDTPTPQISPLSLHDALPISFLILVTPTPGAAGAFLCPSSSVRGRPFHRTERQFAALISWSRRDPDSECVVRSEEHTSELQSLTNLLCPLLLENKKTTSVDAS